MVKTSMTKFIKAKLNNKMIKQILTNIKWMQISQNIDFSRHIQKVKKGLLNLIILEFLDLNIEMLSLKSIGQF